MESITKIMLVVCLLSANSMPTFAVEGWLNWRGPMQNGVSMETGLPDTWDVEGKNHQWTYELRGRGTPVIAGNHLYSFGYAGEGPDLQEYLVCLNAKNGQEIWKRAFNDFLSDIVYDRYSIGSPTVDAETGNVYLMTTAGDMYCFTTDGDPLWFHSMMEEFGRLTFPNGRTGAPVIDDDLVIIHGITSNWGANGPARDRFYAFDKKTGELVWTSTPGVAPKDSSFSTPLLGWENGRRVFYAGTGCGNMVCVDVRTGDPIWRFQMSFGGVNSSALLHEGKVIAIHGKENLDSTEVGRMVAIRTGAQSEAGNTGSVVLNEEYEVWRNDLVMFTSSPVLVEDKVYQVTMTGELHCVDAKTGKILWDLKLANDQLHASPLYADGKLYIPLRDGEFFIIKVKEDGGEILDKVKLEGSCLGSPSVWNGKIYIHTTQKLYCFGNEKGNPPAENIAQQPKKKAGKPVRLQLVPSEVLLRPGESQSFTVHALDRFGNKADQAPDVKWEPYVPPSAKVNLKMDAAFDNQGILNIPGSANLSAGAFRAVSSDDLTGTIRGRVLPSLPYREDFDSFAINEIHQQEQGVKFAYPPLPWIGARFKWEIRERDGANVLVKTLDRVLFQRAITFIGDPGLSNYTIQADVMTDGNRRTMSNIGVINQRYIIALIGNWRQLEVSSNQSRIKSSVPFPVKPNTWYRLKTRVDLAEDGSGIVRAKAWNRDEPEPDEWTIEVPHKSAHQRGAPGIWGFSPQSRFRVYADNIVVTPNN